MSGEPLREIDIWLARFRECWTPPLDALETELARDKRRRRRVDSSQPRRGDRS